MARSAWLDHVPIPSGQIHPMRCEDHPEQAAQSYESLLRSEFGNTGHTFDLAFMGLGENGHTASLFPEQPALQEHERWVLPVEVRGQGYPRLTLTAPVFNQSRNVLFLVSGKDKAETVAAVLSGESTPERLPARLIRPGKGRLIWFLDDDAASCLDPVLRPMVERV